MLYGLVEQPISKLIGQRICKEIGVYLRLQLLVSSPIAPAVNGRVADVR